jgi:hypothetical protein
MQQNSITFLQSGLFSDLGSLLLLCVYFAPHARHLE